MRLNIGGHRERDPEINFQRAPRRDVTAAARVYISVAGGSTLLATPRQNFDAHSVGPSLSGPVLTTGFQRAHEQRRPSRSRLSTPLAGEGHRKAHGKENMVQEKSEYSHVHLLVKKTLYVAVASAWKLTIVFLLAGTLGVRRLTTVEPITDTSRQKQRGRRGKGESTGVTTVGRWPPGT